MKSSFALIFTALLAAAGIAFGQKPAQQISFVYPAGGERGASFDVLIGGRQVQRADQVVISGPGVRAEIIQGAASFRLNETGERYVISQYFNDVVRRHWPDRKPVFERLKPPAAEEGEKLPDIELIKKQRLWLDLFETTKDEEELDRILQRFYYEYFVNKPDRFLPNPISGLLQVRVTIDKDAACGFRELYVRDRQNISTPVMFEVTPVREVCEIEPNDTADGLLYSKKNNPKSKKMRNPDRPLWAGVQLDAQELPVVLNGQIRAGDVDYFSFHADKGEQLVLGVRGRFLSPYLADGVPGWFAPVITVFSPSGKILQTADSWRFDPDPVMLLDAREEGIYQVEIRDALYRGRDDFVYRLTIGAFPFVTSRSSLGVVEWGKPIQLFGRNLPVASITPEKPEREGDPGFLSADAASSSALVVSQLNGEWLPYPLSFAADSLPVRLEKELRNPEKTSEKIQVELPVIIEGAVEKTGEKDLYTFHGEKGESAVVDAAAVSLGSNLDAKIELWDPSGKMIASNDDRCGEKGPNIGLETHHADPYLLHTLPETGDYTVAVYDLLNKGGEDALYRMRISSPEPDFAVYGSPSVLIWRAEQLPMELTVLRRDGFDGEIKIRPREGSKTRLSGGLIPSETDRITVTVSADASRKDAPPDERRTMELEAVAVVNGAEVVRPVIPADKMEQAFIYFHLMPRNEFRIVKRWSYPIRLSDDAETPVSLAYDREVCVEYKIKRSAFTPPKTADKENKTVFFPPEYQVEFTVEKPAGAAVTRWESQDGILRLFLRVNRPENEKQTEAKKGNIIIAYTGKAAPSEPPREKAKQSVYSDYLPAVPYQLEAEGGENQN